MRNKKLEIMGSTIDQDQDAVANQWTDTFLHNPPDDVATQMTQLMAACVAVGDFKTRAFLSKSSELQAPSDQLTVIDYLSHASRIILDYEKLSDLNKEELLQYFPKPELGNGVVSRSATHSVYRKAGQVVEGKGLAIGLAGQLPSFVKTPLDFGVNIAMGGEGQTNFYGKTISANGYSGHFYFHRNDAENLLMLGLEQSAPATAMELVWGASVYAEEIQQGHDQFEQGHSLVGASDTFTAAGSLYFSDPVYQAKLRLEKGCFPPDKYGAMQVTITDENWPRIKHFLGGLKQAVTEGSRRKLLEQLKKKPATAKPVLEDSISYVALDFDSYLKNIFASFIKDSHLGFSERDSIQKKQRELLTTIKELKKGDTTKYHTFLTQIEILAEVDIPAYQIAINRIKTLFEFQLKKDPKLQQTHEEIVLERQYDDLQTERQKLLEPLLEVKKYYQALQVEKDPSVKSYIQELDQQINNLLNPKDDLISSWIEMPILTPELIDELKFHVAEATRLLQKAPKLYSQVVVEDLQVVVEDLQGELDEQIKRTNALTRQVREQEKELDELETELENKNQQIKDLYTARNEAWKETAKFITELKKIREEQTAKEQPAVKKLKSEPAAQFPTMEIMGLFITALGAAAVAIAFTLLTGATFGAVAALGIAAAAIGFGLFAYGTVKRCQSKPPEEPETKATVLA